MNSLDTARLSAALQMAGHTISEEESAADTILINTCTVTARADRQSRQEAHKSERAQKQTVVFGCAVRFAPQKWRENFPGALLFTSEEALISHFGISSEHLEYPLSDRTRVPIAIQTGCDNLCTFCATRIARGPSRDFSEEEILRQIHHAEAGGAQEIVLTGIQLAGYGAGNTLKNPEKSKFSALLRSLLKKTKIPRIRMSSLGPQFLNDDFFEVFQNPRICDHLHLSIQSGSEKILQKMNRGHGAKEIFDIAQKAKEIRPNVAITADFIVGFPFETESDFSDTRHIVESIGLAKLHVFPFSPRVGTGAAQMPQVADEIKKERAQILRTLGAENRRKFCRNQIGKSAEILLEMGKKGFSTNYVRVRIPEGELGKIATTTITEENLVDDFER